MFCCRWFVDYSSKTFFFHSLSTSLVPIPWASATHQNWSERISKQRRKKWSQVCWSFGYIHQSSSTQFIGLWQPYIITFGCFWWFFIFISFRSPACVTYIHIYNTLYVPSFVYFIFNNNSSVNCWQASPSTIGQKRQTEYSFILFIQRNHYYYYYCCIAVCLVQQYEWTKNETLNNPMPGCLNATDTRMWWTKCDERWFVPSLGCFFFAVACSFWFCKYLYARRIKQW